MKKQLHRPPKQEDEEDEIPEVIHRHDYGDLPSKTNVTLRMGKREVFAKNLRVLTSLKGLKATTASQAIQSLLETHARQQLRASSGREKKSMTEIAAQIEQNPVDPKWYRRIMRRGVTRANKVTWRHMSAIALFFGVTYEELWDESLPDRLNVKVQSAQNAPDRFAASTQQLIDLLQKGKGKYDYLTKLIDSLHSEWQSKQSNASHR